MGDYVEARLILRSFSVRTVHTVVCGRTVSTGRTVRSNTRFTVVQYVYVGTGRVYSASTTESFEWPEKRLQELSNTVAVDNLLFTRITCCQKEQSDCFYYNMKLDLWPLVGLASCYFAVA